MAEFNSLPTIYGQEHEGGLEDKYGVILEGKVYYFKSVKEAFTFYANHDSRGHIVKIITDQIFNQNV